MVNTKINWLHSNKQENIIGAMNYSKDWKKKWRNRKEDWEFIIWATVFSQSCFCWLYRASPSPAAKNIINLISVLTIWWYPRVESSLVLLEEGVCYDQCTFFWQNSTFDLLWFVLQGQTCLLLQVSLDVLLLHPVPCDEKDVFFSC